MVDVIMATFVLGVMTVGIVGCFAYGFFVMRLARENQRATQILLEKIEIIRLYNWDQILTAGFVPTTFTEVYDPQSADKGIVYTGTLAITNVPFSNGYSSKMRQLVITLDWTTFGNLQRHRLISTLIAQDGLQNYVY